MTEAETSALANPEFHYNALYKVLMCKYHGQGIIGLDRHLKDAHNLRTKRERQPILDRYAELVLAKPKDVALPPMNGPPFEALREPVHGFSCIDCGYLLANQKGIQGHCNKEHKWYVSKREPTHWNEVMVQTFFGGSNVRYFTVQVETDDEGSDNMPDSTPASPGSVNEADDELKKKFLQEMKVGREKDAERKKILDSEMEKMDNTGWWNHTRWPEHFGDRHLGNIAHASRLPDRKESEMLDAKKIIISMIKSAVDGLSLLHDDTPNWLRTANSTNRVENRPMVRLQNVESLDTYINYWVRFMCYCLRVRAAQRKLEEREEREERRRARREGEGDVAGERGSVGNGSEDDEEEEGSEGADSDAGEENEEDGEGVESDAGEENEEERSRGVETDDVEEEEEEDEEVRRLKDCCELALFNDEQKRLLADMQESLEAKEDEYLQRKKMMALSVSFIMQSIKGLDKFTSVMVHFAAVMGINDEGTMLLLGDHCSFKFAGFIYCIRVLFLEHVLPTDTRTEMTAGDIDRFLEMRAKFLVVGGYNPTGELVKWLGYGKTMSMQKINQPSITWSRSTESRPDKDILHFHGKPLPIRRFKCGIHDMIREVEDILWRDLMWTEGKKGRFTLDLSIIQDDLSDTQRDGSFVSNPANGFAGKEEWMFDRMLAAKKSKRLFGRNRKQFSMNKVREYRQAGERFKKLLLAAVHMCCGPPARGEEITPIRFRNGFLQARNIYVVDGRVIFVTRYHKSQALFGEPKVIPRFLPWRLGQAMAVYLAYVQPFMEELDQQTNGLPRSDHLWHDKNGSWSTYHLTKVLKAETAIRMGQEFTTSGYRHVAVEMGREYVGGDFMRDQRGGDAGGDEMLPEGVDVIPEAGALDNAIDLAAAHTKEIAQRYGVRGDIIKNLTDESLQVFGSICSRWHGFLGLDSRQPPTWAKHSRGPSDAAVTETPMKRSTAQGGLTFRPYSTPANWSMTGSQVMPERQSIAGSQFMSGSQISGSPLIPVSRVTPASRLSLSIERSTPVSRLESSIRTSTQPQRWMESTAPSVTAIQGQLLSQWSSSIPPWATPGQGPPLSQLSSSIGSSPPGSQASPLARFSTSAGAMVTPTGGIGSIWSDGINANSGVLPLTAPTVYSTEEIKEAMQKVLKQDEPEFRSEEQERAVAAVLNLDTPLVVVLPTGGGKSLPIMLAASLRNPGVTILVAPFTALLKDYVKRLKLSSIDHVVWDHGETRWAPLVIVSADHSVCSDFTTYAFMLGNRKLLRRVVLDECHLTFTASDYRQKLSHLHHLRVLGVPMVLLTATLPPTRVYELVDAMSIQNPIIIRRSTVRPNIRYMVQRCPNKDQLKVACEMARLRRLKKGERGIFYCRSRGQAEELAKLLGCGFYHSTSVSKEETIVLWMENGGFCAATGALGTGVDFPGIVYIVHIGIPYGMIDFAQETGRGGRNGEDVDSIILLTDLESQKLRKSEAAELSIDEMAMKRFIETKECRRLAMSAYLDEEGKTCRDVEGRACDHCGEGIADWTATQVRKAEEVQRLERGMDEVQRQCGFCLVMFGADAADHLPNTCSITPGLNVTMSEKLRSSIEYDRRNRCKVCYKCGVSERICKAVEMEQACQWTGVAAALWLSWFRLESCQDILKGGGFVGENLEEFGRWLGLRAQAKVQGDVISNGWWLIWTMLVHRREDVGESTADVTEGINDVASTAGTSSPIATRERERFTSTAARPANTRGVSASPEGDVDALTAATDEAEVDEVEHRGTVIEAENIITRRQRLIQWLSERCIYCELTNAPGSSKRHWHDTCRRSQSVPDERSYDEALEFQDQMDRFRHGKCYSCQTDVKDECGGRETWKVTCEYADIMLHTMFFLYKSGWLKDWIRKEGYHVAFGYAQLQKWLNETSDKGGFNRNRVVEAFEAYALEFNRWDK
jgi:superfamily II DNA or RNA helicase